MRNVFVQHEQNHKYHQLKKDNIGEYNTCYTLPLFCCFFILMKLKTFCITQNGTLKMAKKVRLY